MDENGEKVVGIPKTEPEIVIVRDRRKVGRPCHRVAVFRESRQDDDVHE